MKVLIDAENCFEDGSIGGGGGGLLRDIEKRASIRLFSLKWLPDL
jgi:hypothetical protein